MEFGYFQIRNIGRSRNGFVQNNDGGFMHYLMKRNADLKNILRILVLKTESQF
jgi:hypothetical protein